MIDLESHYTFPLSKSATFMPMNALPLQVTSPNSHCEREIVIMSPSIQPKGSWYANVW